MAGRFCDNPKCDLHVNGQEEEIQFPRVVGNHLEFKLMRRRLCELRGRRFYLCDRCMGVLTMLKGMVREA